MSLLVIDACFLVYFSYVDAIIADVVKVSRNAPPGRKKDKSLVLRSSDSTASYSGTVRSRSEAVNVHGSSDDDKYSGHPSQRFPRQWRLQKRSTSESSTQPYSAPSGTGAQKAENFKKFYEAVVSPTHVRVTAGGRIVPNFRALTQPIFIWNSEKMLFELVKHNVETEQQGPWLQGVSLTLADHSSTASATQPAYHDGCGSPSDSQVMSACGNLATHGTIDSVSVSGSSNTGITTSSPRERIDAAKGAIALSPPSQFDVSRPFMFNGQLVYAIPPGFHLPPHVPILPVGVLGHTNAYHQQHTAPIGMAPQNLLQFQAVNSQIPQQITFGGHKSGLMSAPFTHFSMHPQLHPVGQLCDVLPSPLPVPLLGQPVAMFPNSVMLGNQINMLQQQLKQVNDQLLNNRHQIDEQYVTNQQSYLQNQISELQAALSTQTPQPTGALYDDPRMSNWNDRHGITGFPIPPSVNSVDNLSKSNSMEREALIQVDSEKLARKPAASESETDKSLKLIGVTSTAAATVSLTDSPTQSESSSRQRLRAAAAMAPPFKPRSQLKIAKQFTVFQSKATDSAKFYHVGGFPDESPAQTEAELIACVGKWTTPRVNTLSDQTTNHRQINSFLSPTVIGVNDTSHENGVRTAVPYLVGFPPSGSPFEKADPRELVYSRQLTEEEIHARHLYWGRAPYEATKGLPKFDGRDFYPPSPVKASPKPAMQTRDLMTPIMGSFEAPGTIPQLKRLKPEHPVEDSSSLRGSGNCNHPFNTASSAKWASFDTAIDNGNFVTDNNDDASLKSWGLTKAEEDEIFSSTGSQISSFKHELSSESIRPAGLKRPIARYVTKINHFICAANISLLDLQLSGLVNRACYKAC
jgi:hypothetical protein